MTETQQSTEQTTVAKENTPKKIKRIFFVVTDSLTDSVLKQQGLRTIFTTTKLTPEQLTVTVPNENTINHFILLAERSTDGLNILNQNIEQLTALSIKTYSVAIPPYGVTWRDLALNGQLTGNRRKNTLNRAYTQKLLLSAQTEQQTAELYFKQDPKNSTFIFPFKEGLYKAVVKQTPDNDSESTIKGFFDQKNGLSCDCVNPLGISGVQTKYRFQNWRQYC